MSTPGESRARRVGRGTGLVLAGAVGATALTGIAFAQSSPVDEVGNAAAATAATGDPGSGDPDAPHSGLGPVRGLGGSMLHGEDTVRTRSGDVVNLLVQNGQVKVTSQNSVTVQSEDGFTATYAINADTKVRLDRQAADPAALAVGRPVRVVANEDQSAQLVISTTESGDAAMAQRRQDLREKFRQWRGDQSGAGST